MEVTVRLFAMLRERAGTDELTLEVPCGARVGDVRERLADVAAGLPVALAVNREYERDDERVLEPGDEVALIPPVSGGRAALAHARVTDQQLSLDALIERVRDARAGAVVTFQGVTRAVERLEYDAYVEMAEERIERIVAEAIERHGLVAAAAEHRVGSVPLAEPSVAVAVAAPHRVEAFAAAREIIDRIKAEAPIWKKEVDGGDERWVDGTPA